jgi:cytochrome P450
LLAAHASRERSINPLDWFYNAPTKKNARHKAERTLLRSTLQDIITRRRKEQAEGSKQKHNDLLEYFLEAHDEDSGQKFSDYDLLDELLTMMFAGYVGYTNSTFIIIPNLPYNFSEISVTHVIGSHFFSYS